MDVDGLLEAVVASDRRYFGLGAASVGLPGATLLHLPGSTGVGAGTVVWVDEPAVVAATSGWVAQAAGAAATCGAPVLRVYGLSSEEPAAAAMKAAGLGARQELVYIGASHRPTEGLELRPVSGDDGLAARRLVAGRARRAPDGHPIDPEAFLSGEERRAASGELELFVGWHGGEPVALVGTLRSDDVLRMKNLLVRDSHRRRGLATGVTATLLTWAHAEGRVMGTIALAGDISEPIYQSLGMTLAGSFTEWSMSLAGGLEAGSAPAEVSAR